MAPKKKKPQGKLSSKIIIAGLLAGKKKQDIAVEAGSLASSVEAKCNAINQAIRSSDFKANVKPFLEQLRVQRQRMLDAIAVKDLTEAQLHDLVTGVDKFTKNVELLSGGVTERSEVTLNKERAEEIRKALDDVL